MGSTKERAATIRRELKAAGWNARQVSVRTHLYSMGSSIYVTIRDVDVPLAAVEAIAEKQESIRRCEVTGDILGGGNIYMHVTHSSEARAILAARNVAAVQAAMDAADKGSGTSLHSVAGWNAMVGKTGTGWGYCLWSESTRDGSGRQQREFDEAETGSVELELSDAFERQTADSDCPGCEAPGQTHEPPCVLAACAHTDTETTLDSERCRDCGAEATS